MKKEIEYPCDKCESEPKCVLGGNYRTCMRWLAWFNQQWRTLQKLFARNVSNSHEKKEGDDE